MTRESFRVVDYLVFFGTLVISFSIGIFFAVLDKKKKRTSPDDYFLAGRNSKTLPVALSFIVTFQSSLLILAVPAEVYAYSMMFCYNVVGSILSYIFTGLVIAPVFHPLKITSVNKYFFLRYGDNLVRYLAVFTGVVYNIFYMGTVIYGTCVAAEVVVGIPYWGTVLLYTTVTTIYTSIGGIKAVIWTDVFQLLIMFLGIVAVLIKSTIDAGGVARVTELAHDQLNMGEFGLDPTIRYTFWNVSFGTFTMYLYQCLTQSGIQRINSTPSVQTARRIYVISTPIFAIIVSMTAYEGVTLFAYHASKGCDIFNGGLISNINALVPVSVIELFHTIPGIQGLFIASLSSAALSTLSSCLSSLSAITYEDVIKEIYPNMEDGKATRLSKIVVLIYGVIGMMMTFIISKIPGPVTSVFQGFMGCLDGPTSAVFLLSVFFKKGTSKGIFIGGLCGMAVTFWLIIGKTFSSLPPDPILPSGPTDKCYTYANSSYISADKYILNNYDTFINTTLSSTFSHESDESELSDIERIYTISHYMFSLIGCVVAVISGVVFSLCTKPPPYVDEKYMFSFQKHIVRDLCGRGTLTKTVKTEEDIADSPDEESTELTTFKKVESLNT